MLKFIIIFSTKVLHIQIAENLAGCLGGRAFWSPTQCKGDSFHQRRNNSGVLIKVARNTTPQISDAQGKTAGGLSCVGWL